MYLKSYKELIVWQKSVTLVKEIYQITRQLPASERFGLTSQMQRAAVSIPSNIAEGHQRKTTADFLQFLHIAKGSAAELETQMIISKELFPRLSFQQSEEILDEIQRMLNKMLVAMNSSLNAKRSTLNASLTRP